MTTREQLIANGLLKPTVKVLANRSAVEARRKDVKTQADKALEILRAAARRQYVQA